MSAKRSASQFDASSLLAPSPEYSGQFLTLTTMSSSTQNDVKDSPMRKGSHNALEITDIVDLILLQLTEDKETKKADLLSMAQCCKAFEDPSLSRLWASMSSVVPLLTLIHGAEDSQGSLARLSPCILILFRPLTESFHYID